MKDDKCWQLCRGGGKQTLSSRKQEKGRSRQTKWGMCRKKGTFEMGRSEERGGQFSVWIEARDLDWGCMAVCRQRAKQTCTVMELVLQSAADKSDAIKMFWIGGKKKVLDWPCKLITKPKYGTHLYAFICCVLRYKRSGFSPWVGKIPWRRAWQPTPLFLPGESHGQRSLVGYGPQGHTELDTTEVT